jgi:hypothetical protein
LYLSSYAVAEFIDPCRGDKVNSGTGPHSDNFGNSLPCPFSLWPEEQLQAQIQFRFKKRDVLLFVFYLFLHAGQDNKGYTHKTSGFKRPVSKHLKRQFPNVRFTKRQVYKTSDHQNVRSSKRPVAKKHPYILCTCGWWKSAESVAAMFAGKGMAVFYSLF